MDDYEVPKGMPWIASSPQNSVYIDKNGYDVYNSYTQTNWHRTMSFVSWWSKLILEQGRNIREKMTLFWHNHFAMRVLNDGQHHQKPTIYWNNALLRYNCLGNFRQFIKEITLDPLMLNMLDGKHNLKLSEDSEPNENFAREVQELFLLGMEDTDPNSYAPIDVQMAARIFSGWVLNSFMYIDDDNNHIHGGFHKANYAEQHHFSGDKTFSSFYNNTVIESVPGPDGGEQEIDAFFDMVFSIRGQEVAKHICREIYRFFVSPRFAYQPFGDNTDDDIYIETNIIEPLAQIFIDNDFEIKPVMETLLKSEHFF